MISGPAGKRIGWRVRRGLVLLLATAFLGPAASAGPRVRPPRIPFLSNLDRALAEARRSDRPVVVFFVAAWCPVCERMKRETFRSPDLAPLRHRFVWVLVDVDRRLSTARAYGIEGVPKLLVLDPDGTRRFERLGFLGPRELAEILPRQPEQERPADASLEKTLPEGAHSKLIWRPRGYRSKGLCFSHVGYGPLALDSQSPFQALRLGIRPRTPSTLGRGQVEARVASTWVNVWAVDDETLQNPGYRLDFEMLQNRVSLSYGLTDTLEISGEFQTRSRFGGEMDGFIQGFHDLFGIAQNGRDQVPKGDFAFLLAPPGLPPVSLDDSDRGLFSRTVELSVRNNVTCGSAHWPAFSYGASVRTDTVRNGALSGGDLDFAGWVALARRLGKVYGYATVGHAWFGSDAFRGIPLERTQWTLLLAVEWRYRARQSALFQYLRSEGVVQDFGPFAEASNEVVLGWKGEIRNLGTLEVAVIENLLPFDNSPDFGVHLGYSQRF